MMVGELTRVDSSAAGQPGFLPTTRDLAIEAGKKRRTSGASIRCDHLVIATVDGSAGSGFSLCLEQSCQIELEGRDQDSLRLFREDLEQFIKESGITRILLRGPPHTGEYRSGLGLKIEAVMQLVPSLEIQLVHFNSVEKWKRCSPGLAPKSVSNLVRWEEEAHRNAIATACFGEYLGAETAAQPELNDG